MNDIEVRSQLMMEYQLRSDSSQFLILKALAVIIPEIYVIDVASDEEFDIFPKSGFRKRRLSKLYYYSRNGIQL